MRKYWWVNHKKTSNQEIAGGYLWSPKVEQNGSTSQFYKNMRIASPGDYVLSFANGLVSHVGKVTDLAICSGRPLEFGAVGLTWRDDGWLLPVTWQEIKAPVRPKLYIKELATLLPEKYSPIHAVSGNGNQKAYLAEIGLPAFQLILSKAGVDLDLVFSVEELAPLIGDYLEQFDEAIERQLSVSIALTSTEKSQLIKARRGQGVFRTNVQKNEKYCRLTGVSSMQLLIASHIKPWRSCVDANERLDGNNGLLLTPNADLLFDRGLISFSDDGHILVSPRAVREDMHRLGLANETSIIPFQIEQCRYLSYHRSNVFFV